MSLAKCDCCNKTYDSDDAYALCTSCCYTAKEYSALRTDRDELRLALQGLLALYKSPKDEIGGAERIMLNKVRKLLEAKS